MLIKTADSFHSVKILILHPFGKNQQQKTGEGGVWTYSYCSQTGIIKLPKHNLLAQSKTKITQLKHSIEKQEK